MSFFSAIGNALHTFGAWFEKEWTKLYNCAPKLEQIADATLKYAGPALQIILDSIGEPALAAVVGNVIAEIQKDLHVASGLIYDFGANPQAASIIQSVEADLQGLLAAGHITDPALVAKVQKVADTIGALASALLAAVGKQPAVSAAA